MSSPERNHLDVVFGLELLAKDWWIMPRNGKGVQLFSQKKAWTKREDIKGFLKNIQWWKGQSNINVII